MTIQNLLNRLDKVKRRGNNQWMACCPVHQEKTPSLSIKDDNGTIIMKCFGCGASGVDVAAAVGVEISELFPPSDNGNYDSSDKRVYFNPEQILHGIQSELTVAYLIARESMKTQIDDITRERMLLAIGRINAAINYVEEK